MPQPDLAELLQRGAARPQTPGDIDEVWRRGQARRRRRRQGLVGGTALAVGVLIALATTLWAPPRPPFIQQTPDASDRWGPLAVVTGSSGGDQALVQGTLKITERCVVLIEQDDEVLLVWPAAATTWEPGEGTITYANRDGVTVELRDGMQVALGGGGDSTAEGAEAPQVWAQQIDWISPPAPECLTDTRWWVNEVAADESEWPESCPVTVFGDNPFTPSSEAPEGPPSVYEAVWYGTPELWTMVNPNGEVWRDLPVGTDGSLTQKTLWWSEHHSPGETAEITVTAEHLDASGPTVEAVGGDGTHPILGDFMVVGFELPEPGCWKATAHYKGASLSYVVWVDND